METTKTDSIIDKLRNLDQNRPDFPGEHLIVFGIGVLLLMAANRNRSFLGRTLAGMAGSAFIGRAASGTGGVARVVQAVTGRRP